MSRIHSALVRRTLLASAGAVLTLSGSAHAWLGGFEAADGYQPFLNMVQHYNAGQYGPNGGYGGGPTVIPPNTGLWKAINGGFFDPSGNVSYATGHQYLDRTWVNSSGGSGSASDLALVYTTAHMGAGGGALKYSYNFDAPDFQGVSPAATGSSVIQISFWNYGEIWGTDAGGLAPNGYYGNEINFGDGAGNLAFSLGLTQRPGGDHITYWNGSSIFESALLPTAGKYDRWDLSFDLVNDTVSATFFQFGTSTTFNLLTNVPMMNPINSLEMMTIRSSEGLFNGKYAAIDDFKIFVPTPGAAGLLGVAGLAALRRKRR